MWDNPSLNLLMIDLETCLDFLLFEMALLLILPLSHLNLIKLNWSCVHIWHGKEIIICLIDLYTEMVSLILPCYARFFVIWVVFIEAKMAKDILARWMGGLFLCNCSLNSFSQILYMAPFIHFSLFHPRSGLFLIEKSFFASPDPPFYVINPFLFVSKDFLNDLA